MCRNGDKSESNKANQGDIVQLRAKMCASTGSGLWAKSRDWQLVENPTLLLCVMSAWQANQDLGSQLNYSHVPIK